MCKNSNTLKRCTCRNASFTFEAGKAAVSIYFYDYEMVSHLQTPYNCTFTYTEGRL